MFLPTSWGLVSQDWLLFCLDSYHYGENKMILVSVSWSFAIIAYKA